MNLSKSLPILSIAALMAAMAVSSSCKESDSEKLWKDYEDWRVTNQNWLQEQEATGRYTRVVPAWNRNIYVLMRWLNDRTLTEGNLTPMLTSQVAVTYKGTLYDGEAFDSTYSVLPDSTVNVNLSSVIQGWVVAMEQMRVGDEVEVVIPYESGYGSSANGIIPPYSALKFNIHLHDITAYEIKP